MNNMNVYRVSSGPHVRSRNTAGDVMYDVILALVPAALFAVWKFGAHALMLMLAGSLAAVLVEYAVGCLTGRDTVRDGSAALSGLLLSLTLPPDATVLMAFIGGAAAVVFKAVFGGLGKNRLNPALVGRCVLSAAFGAAMTAFLKQSGWTAELGAGAEVLRSLIGSRSAVFGGSVIALVLGGAYLLWSGTISWHIPSGMVCAYLIVSMLFDGPAAGLQQTVFFLAGGGALAAIFMATDPVTSPVTDSGKLIFGVLAGIISALIGRAAGPAESACLGVLAAELVAPFIERFTAERMYR